MTMTPKAVLSEIDLLIQKHFDYVDGYKCKHCKYNCTFSAHPIVPVIAMFRHLEHEHKDVK